MPEIFIGTDIISIPKLEKVLKSSTSFRFKKRIYSDNEIDYCESKHNPVIHYAGRFAAKEAITKAILSSEIVDSINMKSIEILAGNNGKPEVNFNIDIENNISCKVSISHSVDYAVAFAILETY